MAKTNFEKLEENRKAALKFADSVAPRSEKQVLNTGELLKKAKDSVERGDLTSAISAFNELKDNKLGIVWSESGDLGNGTKVVVRDARNITTDPEALRVDAGEKYAMQLLNEVRAGIDLTVTQLEDLELDPNISPADREKTKLKLEEAQAKLMHIAETAIEHVDGLPKNIKEYNSQLIHVLEEAGIKDVPKKLIFAKEVANFKDEHRHIVTLTTAVDSKGAKHTVTEADIMLNGLTEVEKNQWIAISQTSKENPKTKLPGMDWYNNMPSYKQDLLRKEAAEIATGNKVIPTQLLSDVPGLKNAYQKVTAVKAAGEKDSTIISQSLHSGTPATKIKIVDKLEKQAIVNEQVKQLQSFVKPGEAVNLNILTSKTPFNVRGEGFVNKQLEKTSKQVDNVKVSSLPINRGRAFGGGDFSEAKSTLKTIGKDLAAKEGTKNVGEFLKKGSSILENLAEKITFGKYKSTETKAKDEIKKLDPKLAKDLTHAMKARELVDSNALLVRGNRNLKAGAAMNIVENSAKLDNGGLSTVLDESTKKEISTHVNFCKSGKDRTGYLETKNTHEAVSLHLGVDPKSELGQKNMVSQVSGSHTQEMAGIQGGSVGCHSIKTNPEFGLSSEPQDQAVKGIINQQSSHFNSKVKVTGKGIDVQEFEKSFRAKEGAKQAGRQRSDALSGPEDIRMPKKDPMVKKIDLTQVSDTRARSNSTADGFRPSPTPPVQKHGQIKTRSNSI